MSTTVDERVVSMQFDNSDFEKNVKKSMTTLDKFKRKLKFDDCADSFNNLERSANKVKFKGLNEELDNLTVKINGWSLVAASAINSVVNKALSAGSKIVKSLSIDNVMSGWTKYNSLMDTTHTLMNAVKKDAEGNPYATERAKLDDLEGYIEGLYNVSDETSFMVDSMVNSFSSLISKGTDIESAYQSVIGLNTALALAGADASKSAHLMNEMLQAFSAGAMRAQDWSSFETWGVAGSEDFMKLFMDAAVAEGTLIEEAGHYYVAIDKTKDAMDASDPSMKTYVNGLEGVATATENVGKGMEVTTANFRTTLAKGWLSDKAIIKAGKVSGAYTDALLRISDETGYKMLMGEWNDLVTEMADARGTAEEEETRIRIISELMRSLGINEEKAAEYLDELSSAQNDYGRRALMASQQTKTLNEVISSTKEAAASKWSRTFKQIVGDYLEARELMSDLVEKVYTAFVTPADYITRIFDSWKNAYGGRDLLFGIKLDNGEMSAYENIFEAFQSLFSMSEDEDAMGVLFSSFIDFYEALHGELELTETETTRASAMFADMGRRLSDFTKRFRDWTANLIPSEDAKTAWSNLFKSFFSGLNIIKTIIFGIRDAFKPIRDMAKGILNRLFIGVGQSESLLVKLDKWLSNSSGFKDLIAFVADKLSIITNFILDIIDSVTDSGLDSLFSGGRFQDIFYSLFGSITLPTLEKFSDTWETIKSVLFSIGNGLVSVLKDIWNYVIRIDFASLWENIKYVVNYILDGLAAITEKSTYTVLDFIIMAIDAILSGLNLLVKLLELLAPIATKVFDSISKFLDDLMSEKNAAALTEIWAYLKDGLTEVFKILTGREELNALSFIKDTISFMLKPLRAIAGALNYIFSELDKWFDKAEEKTTNLREWLDETKKKIKDFATETISKFKDFTSGFGDELATNIMKVAAAISYLTPVLAIFAQVISAVAISRAIRSFAWNMSDFFGLYKRAQAMNTRAIAMVILSVVASIVAIVWAVKEMSELDMDKAWKGLLTVGVALVGVITLLVMMLSVAKVLNQEDSKNKDTLKGIAKVYRELAFVLLAFVGAVAVLVGVMKIIDKLQNPTRDILTVVGLVIGLGILVDMMNVLARKMAGKKDNSAIIQIAGVLLAFTFAIGSMAVVMKMLEVLDRHGNLWSYYGMLWGLFAIMFAILAIAEAMSVLNVAEDAKKFDSFGKFLMSFGAAMVLLGGAMLIVDQLNYAWDDFWMLAALVGLITVLAGIAFAMGRFKTGTGNSMKKFGEFLISFAISMAGLVGVMMLIENLKYEPRYSLGVISVLTALVAGLGGVALLIGRFTHEDSASMKAFGAFLILFSISMSGLVGAMGLIEKLQNPWKDVWIVVALGAVIAAMVGTIALFSKITAVDISKMAKSISLLMVVFSAVMYAMIYLMSMLDIMPNPWLNLAKLAALGFIVAMITGTVALFGRLTNITKAIALCIEMVTFVGSLFALAFLLEQISKMSFNIESIKVFGIAVAIMVAAIGVLALLGKAGIAAAISLTLISGAFIVMGYSMQVAAKGIEALAEQKDSFTEFFKTMKENLKEYGWSILGWAGIILVFGLVATIIAAAALTIGGASIGLGIGLAIIAGGIFLIAKAVDYMSQRSDTMMKMLESFADFTNKNAKAMLKLIGIVALAGVAMILLGLGIGMIAVNALIGAAAIALIAKALEYLSTKLDAIEKVIVTMDEWMTKYSETMWKWVGIAAVASLVLLVLAGAAMGLAVAFAIVSVALLVFDLGIFLLAEAFKSLTDAFNEMPLEKFDHVIDKIFDRLESGIADLADRLISILISVIRQLNDNERMADLIEEVTRMLVQMLTGAIRGINSEIKNLVSELVKLIVNVISAAATALYESTPEITEAMDKLTTAIATLILSSMGVNGKLSGMLVTGAKAISEGIQNGIVTSAEWVAKQIMSGMSNGINNGSDSVVNAGEQVAYRTINGVERVFKINSPSKVFTRMGEYLDEGLVEGLSSYAGKVEDAAEDLGGTVTNPVSEAIFKAYDLMQNGVDMDPTIRPVLDLTNIQNGIGAMNGMLSGDYTVDTSANYARQVADTEYASSASTGSTGVATSTTNNTDQSISNVFNISGDDPREIAEEVSRIIQQQIGRRTNVWA